MDCCHDLLGAGDRLVSGQHIGGYFFDSFLLLLVNFGIMALSLKLPRLLLRVKHESTDQMFRDPELTSNVFLTLVRLLDHVEDFIYLLSR